MKIDELFISNQKPFPRKRKGQAIVARKNLNPHQVYNFVPHAEQK
jgi:hypothetical protein